MKNKCIACGMPMESPEHFAFGDSGNNFCVFCAHPDGRMQTWDEKVESMTGFIKETQGLDEDAARKVAISELKKLPAWKDM